MTANDPPLGRILGRIPAVAIDADGLRVGLLGTDDDRRGSLLVDSAHGFLKELRFSDGSRLELHDVDLRRQPNELFVRR